MNDPGASLFKLEGNIQQVRHSRPYSFLIFRLHIEHKESTAAGAQQLAAQRACEIFGADHANMLPYSGSMANFCAYSAVLKPGEMTFSEFCESSGYCQDDSLFLEDDRRVVRGRRIFIVYMIVAIANMVLSLIIGFAELSLLFSNVFSVVLMAVVLFYLYKGYTWARVVTGMIHGARTFFLLFMAGDAFPTAYVQNHGTLSESGEWTSQVVTVYPTTADWLVFSFLLLCLLFEAACLYFICFHKGVKEYLYDNHTSY